MIYIRNGINFHRRHDLEDKFIEMIRIEIKYSNKSILLSTVYRPTDNDGDSIQNWINGIMETSLYKMYSQNKPTILMGDINIDVLSDKVDKLKKSWIDLTINLELNQIINEPTRVTYSTNTLIDHIYVTNDLPVLQSATTIKYYISDHFPVFAVFDLKNNSNINSGTHKQISYRTYKTFNPDAFLRDLRNTSWPNIYTASYTTDECLETFISTYSNILNKHLPIVTKRIKRPTQPPWITKDIRVAMNTRDNAKKKKHEAEYKFWRNKTTFLIREAKNNIYSESIKRYKTNPKMLANVFKELNHQTQKAVNITSIRHDNKVYTRDADIANIFNKHFTGIADKYLSHSSSNNHSPDMLPLKEFIKHKLPKENIFKIPFMTEHFVGKCISNLDNNKATGIDNISIKILKLSSPLIDKHKANICNHSIRTGIFPNDW